MKIASSLVRMTGSDLQGLQDLVWVGESATPKGRTVPSLSRAAVVP